MGFGVSHHARFTQVRNPHHPSGPGGGAFRNPRMDFPALADAIWHPPPSFMGSLGHHSMAPSHSAPIHLPPGAHGLVYSSAGLYLGEHRPRALVDDGWAFFDTTGPFLQRLFPSEPRQGFVIHLPRAQSGARSVPLDRHRTAPGRIGSDPPDDLQSTLLARNLS